jgi:NCAIR mutase (PurE)-related protein
MSDQDIKLDLLRAERTGLGEAVFCEQKTTDQISRILMQAQNQGFPLLLTRLSEHKYDQFSKSITENLNYDKGSATAFFNHAPTITSTASNVAVVAAGTSDIGPVGEAIRTLEYNAVSATVIVDVGVAGLWRLMERLDEIRGHDIILVFAGMDAALVSVLGGLINKPLIAVPTSTGYGAARNGETALAACLTSCAPGITVCNIDNGYGAACAALRILNSNTLS